MRVCNESVTKVDHLKYVECSCCKHVYHEYCTGLSSEVFSVLLGIVSSSGWVCRQCQQNVAGLHTALNKAAEEIADMRTSIAWLYEELRGPKQSASA